MHLSVCTCAVAECDPYSWWTSNTHIHIYIGTYTLQMRRNSMKVLDLFEFGIQCYSQAIEIWCVLVTGVETEKFHNSSAWLCLFFFFVCMCLHGSCPCDHAGIFTGWVLLCLSDPGPFNPVCWATLHCFSLHFVTVHSLALDFSPFFSWKKYISSIMCMAAKKKKKKNQWITLGMYFYQ